MQDRPVALVTGANQGIGLQIAKDLTAKGFTVLLGSRNIGRGEAAAKEVGSNAVAFQLDVTDLASITAAAARVRKEFGRLDVLIQNAAITTTGDHHAQTPQEYVAAHRPSVVSLDEMRAVWDTNVFGVLAVYQAMVPLLRDTPGSRIVNVSSGAGSLTLASDPNSPMHANFDIRRYLCGLEDRSQRLDGRDGCRAGSRRHQGERGIAWLHQDEDEPWRHGYGRGRCCRGRARCAAGL